MPIFAKMDPIPVLNWLVAVVYKDPQHQAPPGRPQRACYNRYGHGGPLQARLVGNPCFQPSNKEVAI